MTLVVEIVPLKKKKKKLNIPRFSVHLKKKKKSFQLFLTETLRIEPS